MLTDSSLVTLYLLYLALGGKWNGPLLWPAVVLHAILMLLLARGSTGIALRSHRQIAVGTAILRLLR